MRIRTYQGSFFEHKGALVNGSNPKSLKNQFDPNTIFETSQEVRDRLAEIARLAAIEVAAEEAREEAEERRRSDYKSGDNDF